MTEHLVVPFAGSGAGEGPLSWGQRLMWNAMQRWRSSLAVGGLVELPPGVAAEQVAAQLGRLVSRHPALRTRYFTGPDGEPRQQVHETGEVVLELVDVPPGTDPLVVAEQVKTRYHQVPWDEPSGWPVRMALVRPETGPPWMVAVYSHLSLDGAALEVLLTDSDGPATAPAPLDQVAWETGPAGRRHNAGTLRFWERQLRAVPGRRFDPPGPGPEPRFRELRYRSRRLELTARLVAARTALDTPAVLLAASATALARVTGRDTTVQLVLVTNRFRAGFEDSVSTVTQPGLCVIDAGAGFDEVVRRAWRASLSAYKHAYCDPTQRDALHARIEADRGEPVELTCYFNNRRTRSVTDPVSAADLDAAPAADPARWSDTPSAPSSEPFFVLVGDDPETVDLQISVDTRFVAAADAESYVRELEAVILSAAGRPDLV